MDRTRMTAWGLTLAGLIPFVSLAALITLNPGEGQRWVEPLTVYGAIILSFLAGARWGKAFAERDPRPATLILSNLPPVAAWLTFIPGVPAEFRLLVLIVGLIGMLYWDFGPSPVWYRNLRIIATMGATLSLGVVMLQF